jgi:hypothetical protein
MEVVQQMNGSKAAADPKENGPMWIVSHKHPSTSQPLEVSKWEGSVSRNSQSISELSSYPIEPEKVVLCVQLISGFSTRQISRFDANTNKLQILLHLQPIITQIS